jgi:uncharacterized protein with HEPN domain
MQRNYKVYLDDMEEASNKIEEYCLNLSFEDFVNDVKTIDAVIMNLAIIGEAVRNIPDEIKDNHSEIEWVKIAALRNIIIHEYFGINLKIIWNIVKIKLPILKETITELLAD